MAAPLPNMNGGNGAQPGQPGGWQGLQGLMQLLQGGLNQNQFSNLSSGYTGGNGYSVGGAHGAFSGLSPWAVHFLTTQQGLLNKTPTMAQDPLTGPANADGTPGAALTGSQLLMAQIHNGLAASGPSQYKLADGITAADLQSMLSDYATSSGHAAYAQGDNAMGQGQGNNGQGGGQGGIGGTGAGDGNGNGQGPTIAHGTLHPWSAPPGVVGYGKKGNAFHSTQAAKAAGRFHQGMRPGRKP